jgi:hypothetical protein
VNLGQSNQNLELVGDGAASSGLGLYNIIFGTCALDPQNSYRSICVLSGSFTGTSSGLTSGTYTLTATGPAGLNGNDTWPGIQQSAGSNFWVLGFLPPFDYDMTLTLVSSTETFIAPIIQDGLPVAGSAFSFAFSSEPVCTGLGAGCSVAQVGHTIGGTIQAPISGSVSFNQVYTYYFSHLAFGGSFQTTLTYVNYSPQAVTCTTNFYDDSGSPLLVPFSIVISTRTDTLAPGGSIHEETVASLTAPVTGGWAQASCTGPVQASLLYRLFQAGTAVGEASVSAERSPTTEFATFAQTATGIAYANPSTTQSATITVEVYNQAGTVLGSHIITLGPLEHGAANVGPLLGLSNFTGFVKITSDNPIISLSLNFEAFPVFSSLPPGDLPSGTPLVQ